MPHDKEHQKDGHPAEYHHQVELAARSMIDRYGNRASVEASIRGSELKVIGDLEGASMWREIAKKLRVP
jgi:hypothetical protein